MSTTVDTRLRLGLAGLLGFEGILLAFVYARGALDFAAIPVVALVILAFVMSRALRGEAPSVWALAALAVVTLARAYWQTRSGNFPNGVLPTYLVPIGFALLAVAARKPDATRLALVGIALVAIARTWFIAWYFLASNPTLAVANLVAAAGAWVWATSMTATHDAADVAPA